MSGSVSDSPVWTKDDLSRFMARVSFVSGVRLSISTSTRSDNHWVDMLDPQLLTDRESRQTDIVTELKYSFESSFGDSV